MSMLDTFFIFLKENLKFGRYHYKNVLSVLPEFVCDQTTELMFYCLLKVLIYNYILIYCYINKEISSLPFY